MPKTVKKKAVKKTGPKKGVAYLTTRALERAVAKGTKHLESEAMSLMGYVVKQKGNLVVKQYADGKVEKISTIKKVKRPKELVLD
jgi:hypothetical protein